MLMALECRPSQDLTNLILNEAEVTQDYSTHHIVERAAKAKARARKSRKHKDFADMTDEELYRYYQLRSLFRFK